MIGICCNESERDTAREFFELFKTPWEFCRPGREYEVTISTLAEMPGATAGLTIVFSSAPTQLDAIKGIAVDSASSDHFVGRGDIWLPIYGHLARLGGSGHALIYGHASSEIVGLALSDPAARILRLGYDLFGEAAFLLSHGQPVENALIPTLELHMVLLREWIIAAGIPLVEIPPVPWGYGFTACLTHDIDFAGIRRHKLDHTVWGFLYRAVVGSFLGVLKGVSSVDRLVRNWKAAFSLPLVHLGIVDDFWDHFDRYAELEKGLASTFFLIPYKHRIGSKRQSAYAARRATCYDITDVREQVQDLNHRGCEIGLHGVDAWHSVDEGRKELNRIVAATGQERVGVRIHWLWFDQGSPAILEQAGFDYDATCGYNDTIGCKCGTMQVFRPFGATTLLELPLHIQDTALFYPRRLGLTDAQAWDLCEALLNVAVRSGGVLTVSWHGRSLAPERLWGTFYERLLGELDARDVWFGTAGQVVQWFRARRTVEFEECNITTDTARLRLKYQGGGLEPPMTLRIYRSQNAESGEANSGYCYIEVPYVGEPLMEVRLD